MKKLKLSNTTYDVMKWICIVALPAIATLISALGGIWNWNIPVEQIVKSIAAVEVFLGVILGISCYNYNKEKEADDKEDI